MKLISITFRFPGTEYTSSVEDVKALKELLNYVANDECEHFWTTSQNEEDHIWTSIRRLYSRVFGNLNLKKLEEKYEE